MLLVLGHVAGDRLVAELGELDPHLLGRHLVHAAAHDRPVAARRREAMGGLGDVGPAGDHLGHGVGQLAQRGQQLVAMALLAGAGQLGDGAGQQRARGDLGVEGLRRGDRHLHVAAVGRVEHAVGLVGQVAVAPVHDADDGRATLASEVDRAVGVGGGAALAHGHHERVGEVGAAGRSPRTRSPSWSRRAARRRRPGPTGWPRSSDRPPPPFPDRSPPPAGSIRPATAPPRPAGMVRSPSSAWSSPSRSADATAQRLAEAGRGLGDLLQEEVRCACRGRCRGW